MKNKYIEQVTAQIQNKTARRQIEQELESHIFDKIDYYVEIGYSYEEAERRATEEMGSPEDTAVPLNGLHAGGLRKELLSCSWTMVLLLISFVSFVLLGVKFNYQSCWYQIFHSIGIDFLSLAFAVIFVLTLSKAKKKHSKILAGCVGGEILLICLICLIKDGTASVFSLFAPMFYSLPAIISQGFEGYADCIFGYGYIPDNFKPVLTALSAVLMIIFLAWSVALFVSIYRKERMKLAKKLIKPINTAKPVISILLSINFVVMAYATFPAAVNLPQKLEDTKLERSMMIETVINWDTSKSEDELLSYLYGLGYKTYHTEENPIYKTQREMYQYNNNCAVMIAKFDENSDDYQFAYITTTQNYTQPLIVPDDLAIGFKEKSWMEPNKITLQKFLEFDWSDKAILVSHYSSENQDTIDFVFADEETDGTVSFSFDCYNDEQSENNFRTWEDYIFTGTEISYSGEAYDYDENDSSHQSYNLNAFMKEIMNNSK